MTQFLELMAYATSPTSIPRLSREVGDAVPEKTDLKKVFGETDEICQPRTIFASNTSTFPITEIAKATKRPDKVIGIHWMNPPYLLPLVEMVRGAKMSDETASIVKKLLNFVGEKTYILQGHS
jgi:enoyl-CoA hydratase/3-hydroxyacyl-CoA dehydrogenase